jgi:hypothetical protein
VNELKGCGWQTFIVAVLLAVLFVGSFVVSGGCAEGSDPVADALADLKAEKAVRAALKTPAAGVGGGGVGSAPPPVLLGWHVPQPDGSVRFVPVTNAVVPPEPIRPFVPPPGTGATTVPTTAPFAGVPSTSLPVRGRAPAPTGTYVLPGIRGGISGCTSYG